MDEIRLREKLELFKSSMKPGDYIFNPTASENDLILFEDKFNIKLPEDYRWFVSNIANGITHISNPAVGLVEPIDFTNYRYSDSITPSIPFPLTERLYLGEKDWDDSDDYPYTTTYDPDHTLGDIVFCGNIILDGAGCGTTFDLIVNGTEYGNVWVQDIPSNNVVEPVYDLEQGLERLNFEQWLHSTMDRYMQYYSYDETQDFIFSEPPIVVKDINEKIENDEPVGKQTFYEKISDWIRSLVGKRGNV